MRRSKDIQRSIHTRIETNGKRCCLTRCLDMPDVHSGYGFCIGNVTAFDMDDEEAIVSPGGVGMILRVE